MTERPRGAVRRDMTSLALGPSSMTWDGSALTIRIDEIAAPVPSRIRGLVRLHPTALTRHVVALDAAGRHLWSPIAPCARVEVALEHPALRWSGPGYLDTNTGSAPLERDFTTWNWSRAPLRRGTAILYDVNRRDGGRLDVALHCTPSGDVDKIGSPSLNHLPPTRWRVARATRADSGHDATVRQTLEDAPFYSRSVLETHLLGEAATAVHESLSLDRFAKGWVQMMLPFRMPRAWR